MWDKIYAHVVVIAEQISRLGSNPTLEQVKALVDKKKYQLTDEELNNYLQQWQKDKAEGKSFQLSFDSKQNLSQYIDDNISVQVAKRTKELKHALALAKATIDATADAIIILDNEGQFVDWNKRILEYIDEKTLHHRDESLALRYLFDQLEEPDKLYELVMSLYDTPEIAGEMGEARLKDGRIIERYSQPHIVNDIIVGRVWSFRDVTKEREAQEGLRLRKQAIEACTHGVLITTAAEQGYQIVFVNPAFERITGYKSAEVIGRNCRFLQAADRNQEGVIKLRLALEKNEEIEVVIRNYRKNGELFWNELYLAPVPDVAGKITHFVGILEDITERKKMEQQLKYRGTHDVLTGLPNRLLLTDRIDQAILHAKRNNTEVGLIFLDLDQFKLTNDSLGHQIGDKLLTAVANRLANAVRKTDTVARLGGDEFIILLSELCDIDFVTKLARNILKLLAKPYQIDNRELNITTSLGISFYPHDAKIQEDLIKCADMAMYQAKEQGRNTFQFYTKELNVRAEKRMALETNLMHALDRNEFILHYQPIIKTETQKIVGMEALIRWKNPELGFISPVEFIPIAEETGEINRIGEWVLAQACNDCKILHQSGFKDLFVSVNLSAKQLKQEGLLAEIQSVLKKSGFDPKFLHLELTESLLMERNITLLTNLQELKALGSTILMDDFGTGYSNLSYLKDFPLSVLKIDRSFIMGIGNESSSVLVNAIIAMAKSLGLKIVAEGVEELHQVEFLQKQQCDYIQGYFFAKPMPFSELQQKLESHLF